MPWHQEPKKDVTSCDKLRGAANKHYIRRFPNGATPMVKNHGACTESIGTERGTWGTETSKYPEEKKSTEIP